MGNAGRMRRMDKYAGLELSSSSLKMFAARFKLFDGLGFAPWDTEEIIKEPLVIVRWKIWNALCGLLPLPPHPAYFCLIQ